MSFTVCAKRLLMDVQDAQSNPKAATLNETIYALLADSENYLQRRIRSDFEDGVPATVAIMRPPFNCNTGSDCNGTALCQTEGTEVAKPRWETFEIDQCLTNTSPYSITVEDYEQACNGTLTQAFTDAVAMAVDELKRGFNTRALAFLKANVGLWTDGATTKEMPLSASTTGQGLYPAWREIQRQFASVGINTRPNVIGGAPIYQIKPLYTNQNPLTGYAAAAAGGVQLYYEPLFDDPNADPAYEVIAWSPQTVQVVTYNKFLRNFAQGPGVSSSADVERVWRASVLRATGAIPVLFYPNDDMNAAPIRVWAEFEGQNDSCGNFKFRLTIRYKFVTVLTDLCGAEGFNGIIELTTCAPVTAACPTPPDPPAERPTYCFSWGDGPCQDPYIVTEITLGPRNYSGVPMEYDGSLETLVAIINSYVGSEVVTYNSHTSNIETHLPIAGGSLNGGEYPFTFAVCAGS